MSHYTEIPADAVSSTAMTVIERERRHVLSMERAFSAVSPKPEVLRNIRRGRTVPIFERQFRELDAFIGRGANASEVLAGVEKMLSDLEEKYLYAGEPASLHTLDAAHDEEFRVESRANPIQLRARTTRTAADLRAALDATDDEIAALKRLRRANRRLYDQKVLLEAHTA